MSRFPVWLLLTLPLAGGCYAQAGVAKSPPPAPEVYTEVAPPARPALVWVPGHYRWTERHGYVWVRGRYVRPPSPYAHWVPGHYETRHHRVWVNGHWS